MSRDYDYDTGYFRDSCAMCGEEMASRKFDRILVRSGNYSTPKVMAKVCRKCLTRVADFVGTELPDIDTPNYRGPSHYKWCPSCGQMLGKRDSFCRNCGKEL